MTTYEVYEVSQIDGRMALLAVKRVEASSGPGAIKAAAPNAPEGKQYAAVPARNITVKTAKTKPAQVSWS